MAGRKGFNVFDPRCRHAGIEVERIDRVHDTLLHDRIILAAEQIDFLRCQMANGVNLPQVGEALRGLPAVANVEYMPWLWPLWQEPPKLVTGQLVPPPRPGLGLEINPDAAAKYQAGS